MSRIGNHVVEQEQKAVDNGSEDYEICQEPDQKAYARAVMQSEEYRRDMEELATPKVVRTYYGCPYDDCKVSIPDDTPSEMNEWLRKGGW